MVLHAVILACFGFCPNYGFIVPLRMYYKAYSNTPFSEYKIAKIYLLTEFSVSYRR